MFFKFNPFQSRISASSQSSAYTPQGVSPYAGRQQPIMFGFKKTATPSAQTAAKSTTTGAMSQTVNIPLSNADGGVHGEVPISPKYRRFMELQQYFMKDDGKMNLAVKKNEAMQKNFEDNRHTNIHIFNRTETAQRIE
ncbi:hypothetical protein ScPMuIL_014165 [Solemya velum]